MTIDYHTWLSRMANSIPDKSYIKHSACTHSAMQVRSALASLLVPTTDTEMDALNWMSVFCACLTGGSVSRGVTQTVIGAVKTKDYYEHNDTPTWVNKFKKEIENGWSPE